MFEPASRLIVLKVRSRFWFSLGLIFVPLLLLACGAEPESEPAGGTPLAAQDSQISAPGGDVAGVATVKQGQDGASPLGDSGAQYPNQPCDPVKRAGSTLHEGVILPARVEIVDEREVLLPSAWIVFSDAAVSGFPNSYYCTQAETFVCPDGSKTGCVAPRAVEHNLRFGRLPTDHTIIETLGSITGKSFEILVDTDDVQTIASAIQPWTDQNTSVFGPNASHLTFDAITGDAVTGDGTTIYRFPPLGTLVNGAEYLLSIRFKFSNHNEITYLWKFFG